MNDRGSTDVQPPAEGWGGSDETAELIRLAGRRPPVPADEIARIKSATYAHWKAKVRQRSERRRGRAIAGLAAAAVIVLGVGLWIWRDDKIETDSAQSTARVQSVVGTAWIRSGPGAPEPEAIVAGTDVPMGSSLETSDGARLAILMPTGHSVRVDDASRVRVLSGSTLDLGGGAVYVDSGARAVPKSLVVRTRVGEIRDVGTQFEARLLRESLRVRVREGSVSLVGKRGRQEVTAGEELELAEDGSMTRRDVPGYGPDWDWIAQVTPMIAIDGRPLSGFLDWVASERGWTLKYADPETRDQAATIILEGSIDELTLDQALDAVMDTCRLTHRVEHGVLIIQ
jgi:ferric-dicitrate binding protein FerR (iron transport regulator)